MDAENHTIQLLFGSIGCWAILCSNFPLQLLSRYFLYFLTEQKVPEDNKVSVLQKLLRIIRNSEHNLQDPTN